MWTWRRRRERVAEDVRLGLEKEVQGLRLDLAERDRTLADLRRQLEQTRHGERERQEQAVRAQAERLVAAAATRIAQLQTQAHLLEVELRPVSAGDVLAAARGLVRVLEDDGMTFEGRPGDVVSFDPARHEALEAGAGLREGEPVEVRFCGVAYRGRLLRKAGVTGRETRP